METLITIHRDGQHGFYARPSAHLPTLSTRAGLGTIFRSSGIVRFVQGGVVKTFRCTHEMSQLQATIELTPDLIAGFAALADAPYDVDSFSRIAQSHGWSLVPPEDWETGGDPFLRVNVGVDYPNLIALWGAENLAGIPLAVLFDDDATVDVVSDTAISAFNSAFAAAKQLLDAELGISHATRTYDSEHQPFPLSFAHYQRAKSQLL